MMQFSYVNDRQIHVIGFFGHKTQVSKYEICSAASFHTGLFGFHITFL